MKGILVALSGSGAFAGLLWVNMRIGRSYLYPGSLLTASWTMVFVLLCFAQSWLYPVSWSALGIFLLGAVYFTLGAYIGTGSKHNRSCKAPLMPTYRTTYMSDRWLLIFLLALLIIGLPIYIKHIYSLTTVTPFSPDFFNQVRAGELKEAVIGSRVPIVENLVGFSSIAALVAFAVTDGARHWRRMVWSLIALAVIYGLLTGSKVGPISLCVSLVTIYGLCRGRLPIRWLAMNSAILLGAFGFISTMRAEALSGYRLPLVKVIVLTLQTFFNYITVSVVCFTQYLDYPNLVPPVWSPWRFFERTANYFGHFFTVPDLNAAFISVGQGLYYNSYNAYTVYFSYYPPYGVVGVSIFMLVIGYVSAIAYRNALRQILMWTLLYSLIAYGLVMTIFNESLLLSLNYTIKAMLVGLLFVVARRIRLMSTYS